MASCHYVLNGWKGVPLANPASRGLPPALNKYIETDEIFKSKIKQISINQSEYLIKPKKYMIVLSKFCFYAVDTQLTLLLINSAEFRGA
jgi:hypothetical protein